MSDSDRLDQFTAVEFFDVFRQFCPDVTREEFEREWEKFQRAKAEHQRKAALQ